MSRARAIASWVVQNTSPSDRNFHSWCTHIDRFRLPVLQKAQELVTLSGEGLEIAAGSSWAGSTLSRDINITRLDALDINTERLAMAQTHFLPRYGGSADKISWHTGDYHHLPFADNSYDFIFCDAGLHHARDLTQVLSEVRRVLRPRGIFVAIREPVLPILEPLRTFRHLTFGWRERLRGDIERIPTEGEWERAFSCAGFRLSIHEYFLGTSAKERLVRRFGSRWNGKLFNRFFFTAT